VDSRRRDASDRKLKKEFSYIYLFLPSVAYDRSQNSTVLHLFIYCMNIQNVSSSHAVGTVHMLATIVNSRDYIPSSHHPVIIHHSSAAAVDCELPINYWQRSPLCRCLTEADPEDRARGLCQGAEAGVLMHSVSVTLKAFSRVPKCKN